MMLAVKCKMPVETFNKRKHLDSSTKGSTLTVYFKKVQFGWGKS